jgi:hypothetical protein
VKILSILCLILALNSCAGIGAITFEAYESEKKSFSISEEKNELEYSGNPAILKKDRLVSAWGEPDQISKEGQCEVVTYYDGDIWSGAYLQFGILPIPLLLPTEHVENRFYFFKEGLKNLCFCKKPRKNRYQRSRA